MTIKNGCKYCYRYKTDINLNDVHKKCQYCPHRWCASVEAIGSCPCICHFGKTYFTFGYPKRSNLDH